eukprot:GHVS01061336.1.p1 GENE.GHVS01061336.1~~GHVS01061336.1.p1  ORF type:complete len:586 (-),score=138.66 GHVS01061336.1:1961-3718(-)
MSSPFHPTNPFSSSPSTTPNLSIPSTTTTSTTTHPLSSTATPQPPTMLQAPPQPRAVGASCSSRSTEKEEAITSPFGQSTSAGTNAPALANHHLGQTPPLTSPARTILLHRVNAQEMLNYRYSPVQLPTAATTTSSPSHSPSTPATTTTTLSFPHNTAGDHLQQTTASRQLVDHHLPVAAAPPADPLAATTTLDSPRVHSRGDAALTSVFLSGLTICALMACSLYLFQYGCRLLPTFLPLPLLLKYLEVLGPATSLMLYVSPAMTVVQSAMDGKHQTLPVRMFVVQGVANVLSIDYGIKVKQPAIYLTNSAGLFIQLLWMAVYNYICLTNTRRVVALPACLSEASSSSRKDTPRNVAGVARFHSFLSGRMLPRRLSLRALLAQLSIGADGKGWLAFLMTFSCCISSLLYFSSWFGAEIVGIACTISNLMLFSVPMSSMGTIIRNRNSDSLPMAMLLMMILCSAVWGVYGYLLKDPVVYVPSLIGYMMAMFQLLIVLWCRGLLPKHVDIAALFAVLFNTRRAPDGQKAAWTNSERYYDCDPNTTPKLLDEVTLNSSGRWRNGISGQPATTALTEQKKSSALGPLSL